MTQRQPGVDPYSLASLEEVRAYDRITELYRDSPLPSSEVLSNLGMYQVRASFGRMQFLYNLYKKILTTHGVIMEFGVFYGQNMALFSTFRNLHEPYNVTRKIIGFDTFAGFPSVGPNDGRSRPGDLAVAPGYENHLEQLLLAHEATGPRPHIKKHELVKGDVVETLPRYLEAHPETIIALAYLDLDLYEPTKRCLELIRPYLARNSIVAFDELALDQFPGETLALREAWGFGNYEILRDPISPHQSYLVFE